jgi:hypothetical protein
MFQKITAKWKSPHTWGKRFSKHPLLLSQNISRASQVINYSILLDIFCFPGLFIALIFARLNAHLQK